MSAIRIETTIKTFCSECGKELHSAQEWSLCRRQHLLDRLVSTPKGREIYDMLIASGFSDNPDNF